MLIWLKYTTCCDSMKCPFCGFEETRVLDSREIENGKVVRRRRECPKCNKRFTTYERIEDRPIQVIKKDGSREMFDKQKIISGILKACEKRNISMEQIERLANEVELEILQKHSAKQVTSKEIGKLVMKRLRKLDKVAYVRFASVYKNFEDIENFLNEIKKLNGGKKYGKSS